MQSAKKQKSKKFRSFVVVFVYLWIAFADKNRSGSKKVLIKAKATFVSTQKTSSYTFASFCLNIELDRYAKPKTHMYWTLSLSRSYSIHKRMRWLLAWLYVCFFFSSFRVNSMHRAINNVIAKPVSSLGILLPFSLYSSVHFNGDLLVIRWSQANIKTSVFILKTRCISFGSFFLYLFCVCWLLLLFLLLLFLLQNYTV